MTNTPAPILNLGEANTLAFNLSHAPWTTQGVRCVVSGTPGSGKSHLMAVMMEEVHGLGVPFCVVDPDGEHRSLCELVNVTRVEVATDDFSGEWIDDALYLLDQGGGVVLDLAILDEERQRDCYAWFARRLLDSQRRQARPQAMFLFVEEVHIFAPQKMVRGARDATAVTKSIARRGRKFGVNTVMGSQRPGDVEKDILGQSNVRFFGRIEIKLDYQAIQTYLPGSVSLRTLRDLETGEFFLSMSGRLTRVHIRARRTSDMSPTPQIAVRQRSIFELIDAPESVRSARCK